MKAKPRWVEEGFEGFDVPDAIAKHPHLADTSWHNDACPSFETTTPGANARMYRIHVDAADISLSEIRREGEGRFGVYVMERTSWECWEMLDDEPILLTDDLDAVLALLAPKQEN